MGKDLLSMLWTPELLLHRPRARETANTIEAGGRISLSDFPLNVLLGLDGRVPYSQAV